nr:PREDICTED: protein FAM205A-like [Latimeria chalumnae]|eukprot:XP_014342994.1 PREDICTED: protein FAM205A-like [Latimeria chalumnae]
MNSLSSILDHLKPESKDNLTFHIALKVLERQTRLLPAIVQKSFRTAYPMIKVFLPKLILPGKGTMRARDTFIPFMEKNTVDQIEINIKHKCVQHLWDISTLYTMSVKLMMTKAPLLPPPIKASGATIKMADVKTPFISNEVRNQLELHINWKKLQHNWRLPSILQKSVEAVIPPAPKLILSQLNLNHTTKVLVITSELPFIKEATRQKLDLNIKKKIIQKKWGQPKRIQESVESFIPPLISLLQPKYSQMIIRTEIFAERQIIHVCKLLTMKLKTKKISFISLCDTLQSGIKGELEMHLAQKSLGIKTEMIPIMVKNSYKTAYPVLKTRLPKLILPGNGVKWTQATFLSFMEKVAVDCLEINIKHKHLLHLWGLQTLYTTSAEMMIPKAPPVASPLIASGAVIKFTGVNNEFIPNVVIKTLDWHVRQKRMHKNWGMPLLIQKSVKTFVFPTPKLFQLQFKLTFEWVMAPTPLLFVDKRTIQKLEFLIRKKILQQRWGLPKCIQESLRQFISKAPPLITDKEKKKKDIYPTKPSILKTRTSFPFSKSVGKKSFKMKKKTEESLLRSLHTNVFYTLSLHLSRKCSEIKMDMAPKQVKESCKKANPFLSKMTLLDLIAPGKGIKRPKTEYISFIELDAVNRIIRNIKHKHILHLWGIPTLYTMSIGLMIPKAPLLPPPLKATGAVIEMTDLETPFIAKRIREKLEWHIRQKRLQCCMPLLIQKCMEKFILPAPKLFLFQLKPKPSPETEIVVIKNELSFISKETKKKLEFNVKKKIIQKKWGLPKIIQQSLDNFIPSMITAQNKCSAIGPRKTGLKTSSARNKSGYKMQKAGRPSLSQHIGRRRHSLSPLSNVLDFLVAQSKEDLTLHLVQKCLQIQLEMIPITVRKSFSNAYPVLKTYLLKLILPGNEIKRIRATFVPFMERKTVEQIEFNIKHKHLLNLWGLSTLHTMSVEVMIPKAPVLPPLIKASGAVIEMTDVDMLFISDEVRKSLERHLKLKRLQCSWSLPSVVQKSIKTFMPLAPKLNQSYLNKNYDIEVIVISNELLFIDEATKKKLEHNIKKKIIQKKWGLPKRILHSLEEFTPPLTSVLEPTDKRNIILSRTSSEGKMLPASKSLTMKRKSTKVSVVLNNLHPESKDKLEVNVTQKSLEIKMEMMPMMVKISYKAVYPAIKTLLPKAILPGNGVKRSNTKIVSFTEEPVFNRIAMDIKHKCLLHLWRLPTLYAISMEMLIPKSPPLPPPIKPCGAIIEFTEVNTLLISCKVRVTLEWHVKQKKVQHIWGMPSQIQSSMEKFIPPAPRILLSELQPKIKKIS